MDLSAFANLVIYPRSPVESDGTTYVLAQTPGVPLLAAPARGDRLLAIKGDATGFDGQQQGELFLCPLTAANAAALRERLRWLRPQLLGLQKSAGLGDRLGLATPGHIRALRNFSDFSPILAQQSMRENARTGRTAQQVLDDAMWGAFQEGWRQLWGADADHLKTTAEVDLCVAAGYTFYTVDPGDHVDNEAHTASVDVLEDKLLALPWAELEDSPEGLRKRYLGRQFEAEDLVLEFDEASLARAAAKYGRAIMHTARMYRHLGAAIVSGLPTARSSKGHRSAQAFELEVSVDETDTPTSPLEHYFVASELKRLGVQWVSMAPRYIGRFEKGVDYIGDLAVFDADLAKHAAIARVLGPYKLSIHTGSDKFSIYSSFAHHAGELVHLKTAGTSYLEALRAIAGVDPELFRQILAFARERYGEDRATYHVSGELARVPLPEDLADGQLAGLLDQFDGRQVLHVTFGSVLHRYGERLFAVLAKHEEAYYAALEAHFVRHLKPFQVG